jgi:hypothetical protein
MWFAFQPPNPARFWMHRTLAPLDMVFVRAGVVASIEAAAPPCPRLPCPSYGSGDLVDGVVEIGAGEAARLGIRPEDGMEVVTVGRLTTYPGRSKYQIVIDSLELAGEGALLALLEKTRARLAAEGLFAESRKRRLPFLPQVIGVRICGAANLALTWLARCVNFSATFCTSCRPIGHPPFA